VADEEELQPTKVIALSRAVEQSSSTLMQRVATLGTMSLSIRQQIVRGGRRQ
jgi:hypothetical protein